MTVGPEVVSVLVGRTTELDAIFELKRAIEKLVEVEYIKGVKTKSPSKHFPCLI